MAGGNLVKDLLGTPAVKNVVRRTISGIEPQAAGEFVKDLLWQDAETFLASVAALPDGLNTLVSGLDRMLAELRQKYPPQLLAGYLGDVIAKIDTQTFFQAGKNLGGLAGEVLKAAPDNNALSEQAARKAANTVNALLQAANRNPQQVDDFVARVMDGIDSGAAEIFADRVVDAALDHKGSLLRLVARQFRRRLGRKIAALGS